MPGKKLKTTRAFIAEAKIVHRNEYIYTKVKYKHSWSTIIIICPTHGEYEQIAANHLRGDPCCKCSKYYVGIRFKGMAEFIMACRFKFDDSYGYSKVDYKDKNTPIIIICPDHGEIAQTPIEHYRKGCPNCKHYKRRRISLTPGVQVVDEVISNALLDAANYYLT
jgi:hypothetical protein